MHNFFKLLLVVVSLLLNLPSILAAEEVFYYHTDNFGTPMAMTDNTGKVVWKADELPFGEEYDTEENPIKNNHRFLGKELDKETGLIYMGARFLDPGTGRFNRPDPVGVVEPFNGGKINQGILLNPQRLNRYAYGLNNPYRYVDPDGNFAVRLLILAESAYVKAAPYVNRATSATGKYAQRGYRAAKGLLEKPASNSIPSKVTDTLAHIKKTGNAPSGYKGGRVFKNDGRGGGRQLPQNSPPGKSISYKEYDVNPYKKGVNRGAERIVRGSNGKSYYTKDHYKTFKSIK